MNKIYKVIWSKVRNCYVAVSEIAKRNGKSYTSVNCGAKANRGQAGMALSAAVGATLLAGVCSVLLPVRVALAADVNTNTTINSDTTSSVTYYELVKDGGVTFTVGSSGNVNYIISSKSGNTITIQSGGKVSNNTNPISGWSFSIIAGINNNNLNSAGTISNHIAGGLNDSTTDSVVNNHVAISGGKVSGDVFGGFSNSGNAGENNKGNTVNISGGQVTGTVYGGYSKSGGKDASYNQVSVSGANASAKANIAYGGYSKTGDASYNQVSVSGANASVGIVYGGYAGGSDSNYSSTATKNIVTISGGEVRSFVHGGYSESGDAGGTGANEGNTVTITGGTITGNVYGGYVASGSGSAINNAVDISGSATIGTSESTKNIYGGYANGTGNAIGNTVDINLVTNDNGTLNNTTDDTGVIWGTVYGGYSASGKVGGSNEEDGNTVTISGGKVSGDIYGGYVTSGSGSAINNVVTISGSATIVTGSVHGGRAYNGSAGGDGENEGNTVNITGGTVRGGIYGGLVARYGNVTGNKVTIENSIVGDTKSVFIYGGHGYNSNSNGNSTVSKNTVSIGGTSTLGSVDTEGSVKYVEIYGGYGGSTRTVDQNTVSITGGTIYNNKIYGGYAVGTGLATNNTLEISGGILRHTDMFGGSSNSSALVSNNTVTIAGGSFSINSNSSFRIGGGGRFDGPGNTINFTDNTVNLYGTVTGLTTASLYGGYSYIPKLWEGTGNDLHIGGTRTSAMQIDGTTLGPWTGKSVSGVIDNKVASVNNFNKIVLHKVNWSTTTPVLAAGNFSNIGILDISGMDIQGTKTLGTMALLKSDTLNSLDAITLTYNNTTAGTNQPIGDGISLATISNAGSDTSTTGVAVAYDGATKVTRDSDTTSETKSTSINYTISPVYTGATLGAMNWGEGYTFASGAVIKTGGLDVSFGSDFKVTDAADQENGQSFNLLDLSATSGTITGSPSKSVTVSKTNQAVTTDNKLTFSWNRTDTVAKNSDGNKLVYTTGATSKVTTATFNGEIAWNTGTPYYNAAGSVYIFDGDTAINATNLTFTGTTDTNPMGQSTVLLANATNISGDHITQPGTGIGTVTVSGYTENGMTYDATAKGTVTVVSTDTSKNVNYTINNVVASKVTLGSLDWGKTDTALPTGWTASGTMTVDATNFGYSETASTALKAGNTATILTASGLTETGSVTLGTNKTVGMNYTDADSGINFVGTVNGHVAAAENAVNYVVDSVTLSSVDLAGWTGTGYTMAAGDAWNANGSGVTVATENITNLPTLSAGASQPILTAASANYFSDDKISATNKYQAYSYTPSVVNGVTFGGSQSKGVKTNDDKSGLVYAVGKMDVSTVSFGTMAWGTGRAASTADDFTSLTGSNINASNLSFTFTATDKEGLSKTSSMTLLSDAVNLTAGLTVTGASRTQAIDYAESNGAALSGTLTGTVVTEASEGVGTIKFNASSMTLDSVNLAGWDGTTASVVPAGWDKNSAGVTVATENMTNLPTLSAGATQAILTTTTANYFSDDKISATNKYQAYSYTPSVVNGVTFGGSQSKGVKTAESGKNLVYAVGKMDVSTVSFGTMAWGTGRAASTADDFAGVSTVDASNLSFTFSDTDKEGLSKTSSTTLLSGATNLAAGKTVTYKNSGTNYTQTIDYAAGNGAALSGTLTGTVSTTAGAASFNANSMTLDSVNLAGWDGTTTSAVPTGWDKNAAGVTVYTNSMTNLPELAAGASRDILTASSGFFTFEKIEGTNKYGNGDAFSDNLNDIAVAGHKQGGIKDTDSGAKLTFFAIRKNVEDITLGEMTFADGGKGATLTSEYDATGATINADNLKFTEASRALMTSGSSMTIVDASAAIKNAGGNALPSFAAKNYDSTFTDSVTDQLTLTGTRRDTLTQDAAQTKLTYTVGDRVVSKAAMSGEIAWQSGDTHYANTAYTFNSSTAVDIANVKFTATDDPLNTSMTLIGNAAGVTAGNVSGSPDFTVALKNTTITATATGNASMDAGDLKYTVTGVTLDSVSVNGVGSDAIPAGWGTVANVQIDTDNMTVPADATYGSPQVIMTASSAIFTDENVTGSKKFGANPARFTDEDNTDAVVIVGKQNAGVKASADGKSLLYEVGKKEASSVTLAKVDWAKGATVFDGSSEEYDYSGIQSLGTDSFDVAYSAPEMVAAGDNMTLLQANATLKDMAAETRSASYSFAPVSGVTVDATVTGSLEAKGGNVTYTATANQASKLTFTNVDWKDSGALMTRPSNITFAGADVDTTKINFQNVKELDANKKMTLVSDFGNSVGTITGSKYTVGAGLEGEGAASLSGSDLVFTTKTGARDLAAQEQTHNTLMVMEAGMAVLAAGNEYVGQTMAELANPQNVSLDGTVTAASLGGSKSRYKTGSHVDSNNWNVAVAVGSKRELKKGSLEWGVFGEYGKSNYTLHSDAGRGDGDSHYAGGGLMAKWTNKHDVYTEASVRLGRLNDTASNLLRDAAGNGYGYDVHANYFGAHVGIGKIIHYKGGKSLDVYGKYFYTKRDGVDFTSGGNNYSLDSVASSILRVGARYGTTDKKWNWYGGLAYEYEFDGKSEGTVDGVGIRAASVKGGSVRGEIGLRMSATKTNPWQTDISIYGYGGKHRGFGGSVNVAYMF
ncbi:MAG: hypothetical protein J5906_01180 [Acidaminococcaceae bacterium]|nr:hypothetical protein [Acidaminococcaceae bacterium]